MKLIGTGYIYGINHIFGICEKCKELSSGKLQTGLTLKCSCSKTTFEKPPLFYLKQTGFPTMIVYKLTNTRTDKSFIGIIVTNISKKIEVKITEEVEYVRDFRRFGIDTDLKKDLQKDITDFEWEVLSTPKTLSGAMIDEKLFINSYNTLNPDGYNTIYMLETLIKKGAP